MSRPAWALATATAIAAVAYDPRAPAADPKRALGLLVVVVALATAVARPGREERRVPAPVLAFAGFVAWSGVTLLWGVPAGARDLAAWVAGAGLAVASLHWPVAARRRLAEHAAALTGAAAAAIAVGQRLTGARGLFVHGGQGNANWLGLLLALTLPLTLGLAARLHRAGLPRARAAAVAVLLQLAGLALSHSRVAWAASALVLTALAVTRLAPSPRRLLPLAGVLVALALPAAWWAAGRSSPAAPVASAAAVAEGEDVPVPIAWKGRVWIWRCAAAAAVDALPFGVGLGGFGAAYLDAQGERLAPLEARAASRRFLNATSAHQDWIEVLVDAGLPALALLALALAAGLRAAARGGWPEGAAALAALAGCAAGDSPLRQPGVVLLLGLVLAGCADPAGTRAAGPPLRPALRLGLLLAAAWLLSISVSGWLAARRLTSARSALPGERSALLDGAARLDPRSGEIALARGLLALETGDAEAALPELRRARRLLANVGTDVALGNAEVLLGRPEAALVAYDAALRRHPGSFRARANVTQPLLSLGRLEEAERHLAVAAALWPGHPRLAEMAEQVRRARIDRATAPP